MSSKPEPGSNEFKLTLQIQKTRTEMEQRIQKGADGVEVPVEVEKRFVSGLASGVGVDLENERMAKSAIEAMKSAIELGVTNSDGTWGMIPLRSGHRNEWDDILGYVTSAEIDKDHNLWIEAELEDTNAAEDLYKTLTRKAAPGKEKKLGLSIAGRVLSASEEIDLTTLERRRVFNEVALREISVVGQPAYPTAFLEAMSKSVDWSSPPINLSREMPTMANDVGKAAEEPTKAEKVAQETDQSVTPEQEAEKNVNQETETPVQAEPDFDADIQQAAAEKAIASQVPDEIKRISAEKKAAKAVAQQPKGDVVQKDDASDALDEVDDAMDDALINAMKASYDKLVPLVTKAKALLDADDNNENESTESEDDMAEMVDDAQDDALIATIREINDQVCDIASTLKQLFRADDAVDSLVENGGYSYYWSKKQEAPDVAKTPKKEHIMDEKAIQELIGKAVSEAVKGALNGQSEAMEALAKSNEALVKKVEELETAPVDKSLSVVTAKEGELQLTPIQKFRKSVEGKITQGNGNEILQQAVAQAMGVQE